MYTTLMFKVPISVFIPIKKQKLNFTAHSLTKIRLLQANVVNKYFLLIQNCNVFASLY